MKLKLILATAVATLAGPVALAASAGQLFACRIGAKSVSVTDAGGEIAYRYGTAGKDEMSIVGTAKSGKVLQLEQRFAGMEYQLRFRNGEFSYIVYSSEGDGRTGALPTSGLVVMKGAKVLSDRSCSPYAELTLPPNSEAIPQDTAAWSAM